MKNSKNCVAKTKRLIACGVFKPAFEYLDLTCRYPGLLITYLPGNLHLRPEMLKIALQRAVEEALGRGERPLVVYGDCFIGIDAFCRQHGIAKISGRNCYEMLLGNLLFESILTDITGTFFVEQELLLNFDAYCSEPLELTDDDMKKIYFEHYRRLLYVRQPNDPELTEQANIIADFLNLTLDIKNADYSYFSKLLHALIKCPRP